VKGTEGRWKTVLGQTGKTVEKKLPLLWEKTSRKRKEYKSLVRANSQNKRKGGGGDPKKKGSISPEIGKGGKTTKVRNVKQYSSSKTGKNPEFSQQARQRSIDRKETLDRGQKILHFGIWHESKRGPIGLRGKGVRPGYQDPNHMMERMKESENGNKENGGVW